MIESKVIADSISNQDKRITTLQLVYPRFIHGELMTHRVMSRNAMSSRAMPVAKMVEQVMNEPVVPLHWGANQPGMQASQEVEYQALLQGVEVWRAAAKSAADHAQSLAALGVHKQVVNRLLEPFQWMHTVVTATEWDNFFWLRLHKDAEPHIQILAQKMLRSMDESKPVERGVDPNEASSWHLPYMSESERKNLALGVLLKSSAARCARVSYLTHDKAAPSVEADLALYQKLVGGERQHSSPLEHQAYASMYSRDTSGNFEGWIQYRKLAEKGWNRND